MVTLCPWAVFCFSAICNTVFLLPRVIFPSLFLCMNLICHQNRCPLICTCSRRLWQWLWSVLYRLESWERSSHVCALEQCLCGYCTAATWMQKTKGCNFMEGDLWPTIEDCWQCQQLWTTPLHCWPPIAALMMERWCIIQKTMRYTWDATVDMSSMFYSCHPLP